MGLKFIYILFIVLFLNSLLYADYNRKEDKTKQLNSFRYEITFLTNEINNSELKLKEANQKLSEINEQILTLSAIVDKVTTGKPDAKELFYFNESELIKYIKRIDKLKSDFRKKIIWLYKNGSDYFTQVLLTSKSLNEFYVRLEYLNRVSEMRKKDFDKIKRELSVLEEKKKLAHLSRNEAQAYIKSKKETQKNFITENFKLENDIKQLTENIENYNRQIKKKQELASNLEIEISNIKTNTIYKIDQNVNYLGYPFRDLKGRLIFPVNSVDIMIDFNRSSNPFTKTVTYNNGIDVSISVNSDVKSVCDGIVEEIKFIPTLGDIIIINHGDGYRTVFGCIKDISVKINDKVQAGKVIAHTSENSKGQSFHFEIWHDKSPVDPKLWIKKGMLIN